MTTSLTAQTIASGAAARLGLKPKAASGVTVEIDRSLEKHLTLFEFDGRLVHLHFHSGQLKTWDSPARIVAMIAGSQGGKTVFGPWWLWREITMRGGGDYIASTSSYDLFKLKMLPEIRNVFEHTLKIGRYWSGDKILELRNPETSQFEANRADDPMWARIILRSASAPGGLESSTAKAAWLDEAGQDEFTVDAWEAVQRRLAVHEGRVLITTTPYNLGWLKQQIVERDGQGIEVINFESVENPAFPPAEFERLRATLPSWKFNMFHRGLYDRPPGMIYSDFRNEYKERGGHKVAPFDIPKNWLRYVGVDPGVIHTCKVWIAEDPRDLTYYVYREQLGERKSMGEHASDAIQLADDNGEYVVKWGVGAKSEIYAREDWIAAGGWGVVAPEHADVEARIDKVIGLLRRYKLFVFDTCSGTLDQFGTYSRKLDSSQQPTKEIKDKERYHYLDALGYGILTLDETYGGELPSQLSYSQAGTIPGEF